MKTRITLRETEILRLVSHGHTTKEVASRLFISVETARTHRKNLLKKMNAKTSCGLVRRGFELGILAVSSTVKISTIILLIVACSFVKSMAQVQADPDGIGIGVAPATRALHIRGSGGISDDIFLESSTDATGDAALISLARSEGSPGSPLPSSTINNSLGRIAWRAYNGTGYNNIYYIEAFGAENPGSSPNGLFKIFTRNGLGTHEVFRLDNVGNLTIPDGRASFGGFSTSYAMDIFSDSGLPSGSAPYGGLNMQLKGSAENWTIYPLGNFLQFYNENSLVGSISAVNGQWVPASDKRIKDDIRYIQEEQLEKIMLLKPATYVLKKQEDQVRRAIGFIAQDAAEVYPDIVFKHPKNAQGDEILTMSYTSLIPYLVKGIQELAIQNQELQDEVQKLIIRLDASVSR